MFSLYCYQKDLFFHLHLDHKIAARDIWKRRLTLTIGRRHTLESSATPLLDENRVILRRGDSILRGLLE
jgi:hypothetical protein